LTPIDNFGLVDLEPGVVVRGEARNLTDCAIDVDRATASTADEVMVIVSDPHLVAGG
jgi:hypothetical protein